MPSECQLDSIEISIWIQWLSFGAIGFHREASIYSNEFHLEFQKADINWRSKYLFMKFRLVLICIHLEFNFGTIYCLFQMTYLHFALGIPCKIYPVDIQMRFLYDQIGFPNGFENIRTINNAHASWRLIGWRLC